jgi:prepilin-type N-terminal cleavage/methylation domain-containing protein
MSANKGFTLLEVLIVVGIMALIAAMVWPMLGTLDDAQRHRITMEKMDAIEDALLGPRQGIVRLTSKYCVDHGATPSWEGQGVGSLQERAEG